MGLVTLLCTDIVRMCYSLEWKWKMQAGGQHLYTYNRSEETFPGGFCPDGLWGPQSLVLNRHQTISQGVTQLEREATNNRLE